MRGRKGGGRGRSGGRKKGWRGGKSGGGRKGGKRGESDPVARLKAGVVTSAESSASDSPVHCPFCDAEISATARKCRHCSEWVTGQCRQCGVGLRKRWAARSLCANCELVVSVGMTEDVLQHVTATGGLRRCARCGIQTMHMREEPNHVLHLLLSVFTIGIWLPVWVVVGFLGGRWRCGVCGGRGGGWGLW